MRTKKENHGESCPCIDCEYRRKIVAIAPDVLSALEDVVSWAVTLRHNPTTTLTTREMVQAFNADIDKAKNLIAKIKGQP